MQWLDRPSRSPSHTPAPLPTEDVASPDGNGASAGYEWVALSVTTVGALLAAVQGSSLIIALPDVLTGLDASFLTIMWVLLGYLLITTALVPVVGRLADMFGRKTSVRGRLRRLHARLAAGRRWPSRSSTAGTWSSIASSRASAARC